MMTKLKPLARFTYASAFFIPFAWTAAGFSVPLHAEQNDHPITLAYAEPIDSAGTLDIVALADLDNDPSVITAEEREMMDLLRQVLAVPTEDD